MGTIVLCNVHIGNNVVIGAGSVVTHDLPSNGVYAGAPAKYIGSIENYKEKNQKLREKRPIFDSIVHGMIGRMLLKRKNKKWLRH